MDGNDDDLDQFFSSLAGFVRRSPRSLAEQVPGERLQEQIAGAKRSAVWFEQYAEALGERLSELRSADDD